MKNTEFEHIGLIRKIAWSFHCTTGLDFEDLVSEGLLKYHEAAEHWDPKKGKMSTFIYTHIRLELINYCKHEMKFNDGRCDLESAIQKSIGFEPIEDKLPKEAQEVLKIIKRLSSELVVMQPLEAQERIRRVLEKKGWPYPKIQYGLSSLQMAIA